MRSVRFYSSYPLEFMGGGESTILCLANHLGAKGWSVKLLADSRYSGMTRVSPESVRESVHSFEYLRTPFERRSPFTDFGLVRRTPRIDDMPTHSIHVVLIDRVPPIDYLVDLVRHRLRVLFLLFGIPLDYHLPPQPAAAAYELAQRASLARLSVVRPASAIHFQVLTEAQGHFLTRAGIPPLRIHLIRSGVRIPQAVDSEEQPRFEVLFMGRMERISKGVNLLREIAQRLQVEMPPDLELSIIGSGRDSAVVAEGIRTSQVRYEGYVTESRKEEFLRRAQVVLSTSYLEPYSLVVAEAIANGVFVLSTPASGPASIVNLSPGFGEVLDYDAETFVRRIHARYHRWKSSSDHLHMERRERRRTAARLLSEEEMCRRYEALLAVDS